MRHAEMVEQIDHVAGEIAHSDASLAAELWREAAPSARNGAKIRFPHGGLQREGVKKHNGAERARANGGLEGLCD
jgi:hypothetical protein